MARTVKMPGFRPGKVPFRMVAQNYGPQARSEAIGAAVERVLARLPSVTGLKVEVGEAQFQYDEALLDELYQLARRLDERMDTVERLVASEHPEFKPGLPLPNSEHDNLPLGEIDRLRAQRQGAIR